MLSGLLAHPVTKTLETKTLNPNFFIAHSVLTKNYNYTLTITLYQGLINCFNLRQILIAFW